MFISYAENIDIGLDLLDLFGNVTGDPFLSDIVEQTLVC